MASKQPENPGANRPGVARKRKVSTPEERELRRHLRSLTVSVGNFLATLDAVMVLPASTLRNLTVGKLASALDLHNDIARHGGLKVSIKGLAKKPKSRRLEESDLRQLCEELDQARPWR